MSKIKLEYVKPGMVLNGRVKDLQGIVLLDVGDQINEKNIRICKMWGITEIDVRDVRKNDVEDKSLVQIDPPLLKETIKQAQILFQHTDLRHAAITELYRLYMKRIAAQKSKSPANEG